MGAGGTGRQRYRTRFRHPRGAVTGPPDQEVKRLFDFPLQAGAHHSIVGATGDQSGLIGFGRVPALHRAGIEQDRTCPRRSQTVTTANFHSGSLVRTIARVSEAVSLLNTITSMADVQVCSRITTTNFCYVLGSNALEDLFGVSF